MLYYLILLDATIILPFVILFFFKPKRPTSPFGYRTARSTASQANWDFSQNYCSKLFIYLPLLILPTQVFLFFDSSLIKPIFLFTVGQFVLYSIIVIIFTETALKKFEKEQSKKKDKNNL